MKQTKFHTNVPLNVSEETFGLYSLSFRCSGLHFLLYIVTLLELPFVHEA